MALGEGECLPSDRRYALLFQGEGDSVATRDSPALAPTEWRHKSNFMSVFSRTRLCAGLESSFDDASRTLHVRRRGQSARAAPLLAARLDKPEGRAAVSALFSAECGAECNLVEAGAQHAFGNTAATRKASSVEVVGSPPCGTRTAPASGDTRCVHIVNENTVAVLAAAAGVPIEPGRFRPNIVLGGGLPAWAEFGWVGRRVRVGGVTLRVVKRTVRCSGLSLHADAADAPGPHLDVPELLSKFFPEHGPYCGVYAQVEGAGAISLGDAVIEEPVGHADDWLDVWLGTEWQEKLVALCFELLKLLLAAAAACMIGAMLQYGPAPSYMFEVGERAGAPRVRLGG